MEKRGEPRCVSPRTLPLSTLNSLITTLCRFGPPSDSSFSSIALYSSFRENSCQSSFEFVRLRPFPVFHWVLCLLFVVFEFVRVCRSSFEFVAVRSSLSQFVRVRIPPSLPGEPRCVSPRTLPLSTLNSLITTLCRFGPPSDSSFSSVPLYSSFREIWCQCLIKFVRLRQFPVFHRVLSIFSSCSSLFEFVAVRSSSNPTIAPRRAEVRQPSDSSPFYSQLTHNYSLPLRPALGLFVLFHGTVFVVPRNLV